MMKTISILFFLGIISTAFIIPDKIAKKADKVIAKFFDNDNFTKEVIHITEEMNFKTLSEFGESNLFKIISEEEFLGYGYIGNALSKTADFDYLVLFDKDFIITKSKVLVYREEYGGEIGSKRWLKQFVGKSSISEGLVYGKTIVPISGATISVKSMTKAINNLLISVGELQKLNLL